MKIMKKFIILPRNITTSLFALTLMLIGYAVSAQTSEKMNPSIQLSVTTKADHSMSASVFVTANSKAVKKRQPAGNAKINFYTTANGTEKLLGSTVTEGNGKAEITFKEALLLDTGNNYTVIAKIENDPMYENTDEDVHFKKANLTINLKQQDTLKLAIAKITSTDKNGKEIPVKNTELSFFIQRLFGAMPIVEDNKVTTDENGEATFTFPKSITIPGDEKGNFIVVAKLIDNETYGNIETHGKINWGVPVPFEKNPFPRALWEANAPPALVITICLIFGSVWSIYFFMFMQLGKIKKDKGMPRVS